MNKKYTKRELLEFQTWYSGLSGDLREFYNSTSLRTILAGYRVGTEGFGEFNAFWLLIRNKKNTNRIMHSSLPYTIIDNMTKTVFSGGVELKSNVNEKNKDVVEEDKLTFYEIKLKQTNYLTSFNKFFTNLLIFGKAIYKIVVINGKPVIKIFSPLQVDYDEEDELQEFKFYEKEITIKQENQQVEDKVFIPAEIFGNGYIRYSYLKKQYAGENIDTLENYELVELTNEEIIQNRLENKPSIIFKEKINLAGALDMGITPMEKSIQLFDAYDEITSLIVTLVRKSKPLRFIPEELLPKKNGKTLPPDDMQIDFQGLDMSPQDKDKNEIVTSQIDYDYEKTLMVKEEIFNKILAIFGIDAYTIGIQKGGFDGAELSRSREAHTIRTFENYKILIEPLFSEMVNKLIFLIEKPNLNTFFMKQKIGNDLKRKIEESIIGIAKKEGNEIYKNKDLLPKVEVYEKQTSMEKFMKANISKPIVDYEKIIVNINDFIKPSYEDKVKIAGESITLKVSDVKTQLKALYPDLSEKELEEIKENIYIENNISTQEEEDIDIMNEENPSNDKEEKINLNENIDNKDIEKLNKKGENNGKMKTKTNQKIR